MFPIKYSFCHQFFRPLDSAARVDFRILLHPKCFPPPPELVGVQVHKEI